MIEKPTRRQCFTLMGAGLAGLWLAGGARAEENPRTAPEQFHRFGIDQQTITLVTTTGHYPFLVAVVSNASSPESALMARRPVARDEGILYTVQTVGPLSISNRGVPFPTDLMFVSRDGRILEIHPSIMANDSQVYSSRMPVKAALQVVAGTVMRIAAAPGDYVLSAIFGRTL